MAYSWEFFSNEVTDDVIAERSDEARESMKGAQLMGGVMGDGWLAGLNRNLAVGDMGLAGWMDFVE